MTTRYITRTTRLSILPEGEDLSSAEATEVEIVDEGAGEFVVVTQAGADRQPVQWRINPEEWDWLRPAIDKMIENCRK